MEDIYKRFHGVAGQAHLQWLVGVVCAHKIDLATVHPSPLTTHTTHDTARHAT